MPYHERWSVTAAVALVAIATTCCAARARPSPDADVPIGWRLQAHDPYGDTGVICGSALRTRCVLPRTRDARNPVEATFSMYLYGPDRRTFTGHVELGFIGSAIPPVGHTIRLREMFPDPNGAAVSATGVVTSRRGRYRIRFRLTEMGPLLRRERRYTTDVPVDVQ